MKTFLENHIGKIWMTLVYLFLYTPLFFMMLFSFNSTRQDSVFTGFSLRWYEALGKDSKIVEGLSSATGKRSVPRGRTEAGRRGECTPQQGARARAGGVATRGRAADRRHGQLAHSRHRTAFVVSTGRTLSTAHHREGPGVARDD